MKEFIFIIAVIASLLTPMSVQAADQNAKTLDVPFETQGLNQPNQWCGAASLSMVLRYNGIDTHLWDIASYFQTDPQTGIPMEQQKQYVQHFYPQLTLISGTATSIDQFREIVKTAVDGGNPVILWSVNPDRPTMKHYFVVTGYDEKGIYIHDSNGFLTIKMMNGPVTDVEEWMNSYLTWDAVGPYLIAGVNTVQTQNGGNYLIIKGGGAPLNGTLWINDGDVQVIGNGDSSITLTYDKGLMWITNNHDLALSSGDSMAIKMTAFNAGSTSQEYHTQVTVVGVTDGSEIFSRNDVLSAAPDSANTLKVNLPIGSLIKTQEPYKVILAMNDANGNRIDEFSLPELKSSIGTSQISMENTSMSGTPIGAVTSEIPDGAAPGLTGSPVTTTPKSGSYLTAITAVAAIIAAAVISGMKRN
jgi:uncharacterized protein YvpB